MSHSQISQQLQTLIQHATEDSTEARSKASDSMSLNDKMELWSRRSADEPSKTGFSELFEGVEDEDEEEEDSISDAEVLVYSRTVFTSTAYDWLVQSLLKQSTFHWDNLQPRTMIDGVQQPILRNLPSKTISKRRDPTSYGTSFWLPWRPISQRIKEEQTTRVATPISEITTLTASSVDQSQVTTVKEYFDQTWVLGGVDLLRAVQKAANSLLGDVISGENR